MEASSESFTKNIDSRETMIEVLVNAYHLCHLYKVNGIVN